MDEFYLQDSRSYVGNDVLWWAIDSCGHTTDLRRAHVFTKSEAIDLNLNRETDLPWPKEYIDQKTRPAVDMQNINRKQAMKGSGIRFKKPKKRRQITGKHRGNCPVCGKITWDYNPYENAHCLNHQS